MGENSNIDGKIAQIAARQHWNVTRSQLLAAGLASSSIAWRVQHGRLFRQFPGVYSVGHPPSTPLQRAAAAVLAFGERAALSHSSAMTLWGFWKRWEEPFEVTVATDRRRNGITVHRAAGLLRRDVRMHLGVCITSPARVLLDMAPRLAAKSLTRAVNDGRREGLITVPGLTDVIERFQFHPGAPLLRPHAGVTDGPTRSELEDLFLAVCRRFPLPTPKVNAIVEGYEVDTYFETERLIVELDGWKYHNDLHNFEADRERDATLLAVGIATIRITWKRLRDDPEREADRLRGILEARRRAAA